MDHIEKVNEGYAKVFTDEIKVKPVRILWPTTYESRSANSFNSVALVLLLPSYRWMRNLKLSLLRIYKRAICC